MIKNFFLIVISLVLILFSSCSEDLSNSDLQSNGNAPEISPTTRVVSEEQALIFAGKMFAAIQAKETPQTRSTESTQSCEIETIINKDNVPVMYVVNFGSDQGYMLLSADKESKSSLIAFDIKGKLDLDEMNPNSPMGLMIDEQREKITKDIDKKINVDDEKYSMWESLGKESDGEEIEIELIVDNAATTTKGTHKGSWGLTPIGPWGTVQNCLWGQANGYNANALHPNSDLAGCPAVAVGLLCRVWSYPSNRGFEYAAMPNSLAPTTASNPISRMFRAIADVIPGYSWGTAASGGSGASEAGILTGLRTLGYNSAKSGAYDFNTVYANIDDWYPVLLGGFSSADGHIWIADGYSETTWKVTRKFLGIKVKTWYEYSDHIYMNWGWYGSSNGWIDQASWPSFSNNRRMWYDLFPR
jgi:hypothetical protein